MAKLENLTTGTRVDELFRNIPRSFMTIACLW